MKNLAQKQAIIERLCGDGNYTRIHLENGRVEIHAYTLAHYQSHLPGFLRIHKQHLINPMYVHKIGASAVTMLSGKSLPIARRRHTEVVTSLTQRK